MRFLGRLMEVRGLGLELELELELELRGERTRVRRNACGDAVGEGKV